MPSSGRVRAKSPRGRRGERFCGWFCGGFCARLCGRCGSHGSSLGGGPVGTCSAAGAFSPGGFRAFGLANGGHDFERNVESNPLRVNGSRSNTQHDGRRITFANSPGAHPPTAPTARRLMDVAGIRRRPFSNAVSSGRRRTGTMTPPAAPCTTSPFGRSSPALGTRERLPFRQAAPVRFSRRSGR